MIYPQDARSHIGTFFPSFMKIYVSESSGPGAAPGPNGRPAAAHSLSAPYGAQGPVTSHDQRTMMQSATPQSLSFLESTPVAEPAIHSISREDRE